MCETNWIKKVQKFTVRYILQDILFESQKYMILFIVVWRLVSEVFLIWISSPLISNGLFEVRFKVLIYLIEDITGL